MRKCGLKLHRFDKVAKAIKAARPLSIVLLLADDYPRKTLEVAAEDYKKAEAKNVFLYVEYPSFVPGVALGPPRKTIWERFVVNDQDADGLARGQILMAHECQYLPCAVTNATLVVARVAGFDTAVFGIPASAEPILFPLNNDQVAIATTKLSGFITSRFAPTAGWEALWSYILGRKNLSWRPTVEPAYGPHDPISTRF